MLHFNKFVECSEDESLRKNIDKEQIKWEARNSFFLDDFLYQLIDTPVVCELFVSSVTSVDVRIFIDVSTINTRNLFNSSKY